MLLFAPLAQYIPRPALAGVLMLTAMRMTDPEALRYHFKATRFDALIVSATALAAIVVSVEFCILVGVLLSFMFYVPKAARIEVSQLVVSKSGSVRERLDTDALCDRLRIELRGELFFGASPAFEHALERIEAEMGRDQVVLLRCCVTCEIGMQSACMCCMSFCSACMLITPGAAERSFATMLTPRSRTSASWRKIGEERVFREVPELWSSTFQAIQYAYKQIGDRRCTHCPRAAGPVKVADDWSFVI